LITLTRSLSTDLVSLMSLFGHYLMGWAWLTPLMFIFGFNIKSWLASFNFFGLSLLIGSILSLFSFFMPTSYAFGILEWMAFLSVMILTYSYQNGINQKITILAVIAFIILSIEASQRVNALFLTLIICFTLLEYIRNKSTNLIKKITIIFFIISSVLLSTVFLDTLVKKASQNKSLTTDTRTFLFVEMFSDLSTSEEIFGRGALGKYYSPYFANITKMGLKGDSEERSINEVGYLEIILKGGYVMLLFYLLILIPAAFLGIVKSNNYISRMSGYFILSYLIIWLLSYYPVYSAEYLLLWMAAGTALSPSIRKLTNADIFKLQRTYYG